MAVHFKYHPAMVAGVDNPQTLSIYFVDDQLLVKPELLADPSQHMPWSYETLSPEPKLALLLGELNDSPCRVVQLESAPDGWQAVALRDYLLRAPEPAFKVINAAAQLRYWLSTQNFCSRCGHNLEFNDSDRALACAKCGYLSYPKVSPCIITVVRKGREILLGQPVRIHTEMYSCLAGFIEAGESAEDGLKREVLEESGIHVHNIQYQFSQAWPFPHQLMLGYLAEYKSGDLLFDPAELRDARWFDIDELPTIPPRQTISRKLIDASIQIIRQEHS
ncbi:NADH pyrophosphatase [Hahella sp. CCB-MM4]|uniref:NAD(+) diphosphatase n=1 Tax=Hahella sp. (strain CCB-MM4) TaxID=1926491 RepID=UPI000B9A3B05|nr:NAD(+) diphosphatase [Hahella sp. CCB-MM4]OZG72531.1 NADH pyrophosphatase [Hahella sp. CCB-MM4]